MDMDFPTKNPQYSIQQSDFGTERYNATINIITPAKGYAFDFPIYATKFLGNYDYKVLSLVDTTKNTIQSACIVVSAGNIKEIYAFTKHASTPKGIASLLLSTLIDFHRANNTDVILWVGVKEETVGLIEKVYKPLGFYFPESVGSTKSPLGNTSSFPFFSGFWSSTIEPMLPSLKLDRYVVLSDSDANTKALREGFFSDGKEIGGLIFVGDGGYLKVDNVFQYSQVSQCETSAPFTSEKQGYLFSYHTHPRVCHEQYGIFLGFPSTVDYARLVRFFLLEKGDGHFVFTVEGVFFIQPHPLLKFWIKAGNTIPEEKVRELTSSFASYLISIDYETKRKLPTNFYNPERGDTLMTDTPEETQALTEFRNTRMNELLSIVSKSTISILGITIPFFFLQFLPHSSEQKFNVPNFFARSSGGGGKKKSKKTRRRAN